VQFAGKEGFFTDTYMQLQNKARQGFRKGFSPDPALCRPNRTYLSVYAGTRQLIRIQHTVNEMTRTGQGYYIPPLRVIYFKIVSSRNSL